jgi:hypothetical protein
MLLVRIPTTAFDGCGGVNGRPTAKKKYLVVFIRDIHL